MLRTILAGAAGSLVMLVLLSLQSAMPRTLPHGVTPEDMEILSHMSIVYLPDGVGGQVKTVRFEGVNVQVVHGPGTPSGVGNLIIGYSVDSGTSAVRTGYHNLVLGAENAYLGEGGIVAGYGNTIGGGGSVLGGDSNTAGSGSVVVAGSGNLAASGSCILSGNANRAYFGGSILNGFNGYVEDYGVVVGGQGNYADDGAIAVGGLNNGAYSDLSVILGGADNQTPWSLDPGKDFFGAIGSCIVGGKLNITNGYDTVVVGGEQNSVHGLRSVVVGGRDNDTIWSATTSVIAGGFARTVSGEHDFVAGSLFQDQ